MSDVVERPKPVLSVITERRNGAMIAEVARLWIGDEDCVTDVTYGRGKFWTKLQPPCFTAHDIASDGVDFRQLPEDDGSADVVVFDPPYIPQGGRETSTMPEFLDRYGLFGAPRNQTELEEMNRQGVNECARILRKGGRLLVKCSDYVSGGRFQQGRRFMVDTAEAAGLELVDEFVHFSGTGPQPPRPRQLHSRRAHSFLLVFERPNRKRRAK